MDSIKGIVSDLHVFLYGGMRTLPITLAGTMAILGLFTANYGLMFLLLGFMIVTPIVAFLLNSLADAAYANFGWSFLRAKTSDICHVAIPFSTLELPTKGGEQTMICTTSLAMICFFLGYVLTNATSLYTQKQEEGADPTKVSNRKTHTVIAIASVIIFAVIAIGFRMYAGCESPVGLILGIPLFGALGMGWYNMLSSMSGGRLSDIFGISNRILPASATAPVACIPS
jgi:hypothetical protein